MFINSIAHYLPNNVVPNDYFEKVNGLTDEWIVARTGIKNRRRAKSKEDVNSMSLEAVKEALIKTPYDICEVDLIVGATYTPVDTIRTISVNIQREYNISNVKSVTISAACSSFINAIEIVEGYFASGKAGKALVVVSDNNSGFSDDSNPVSGHLWGDGAVAVFLSKERTTQDDLEVIDVITKGLANVGYGPDGVFLRPQNGGLTMPHGKDVFMYACNYMADVTREIAANNQVDIDEIDYLIPHQANIRIINNVVKNLKINKDKVIVNIDQCGNTGGASSAIGLSQHLHQMPKDALIVIAVFGGGYSAGAMLLRR